MQEKLNKLFEMRDKLARSVILAGNAQTMLLAGAMLSGFMHSIAIVEGREVSEESAGAEVRALFDRVRKELEAEEAEDKNKTAAGFNVLPGNGTVN